jgi:CubicO group peptidase (beta-lactamase class C family)
MATGCLVLLHASGFADPPPAVGVPVPELSVFDDLMQNFMEDHAIPGGALGIMSDGVVVFERAYGWQDELQSHPIRPNVVMRVASMTKPVSAAAIRTLIAAGALNLTDRVFNPKNPGAGVLEYLPFGTPDVRLGSITIEHLLQHRGGWDRGMVGDLTYMEQNIADDMEIPSPPGRVNTARWIMGQPLQHDPGSTTAYSNIGYLLLGLIVEERSGMDYLSYVHDVVFAGSGLTEDQLFLGRSFKADQDLREPHYHYSGLAANVFYLDQSDVAEVFRPYGSWDHEARTGQGRIVASTRAFLTYLDRFTVNGSNIGEPRPPPGSWKWNHTGSLPGTDTLARQRGDGINYVVLFNQRPASGASYASQVRVQIDQVLDANTIATWPTTDPASNPPVPPEISINASVDTLQVQTAEGRYYQLQYSYDLQQWLNHSTVPFIGDGTGQSIPYAPGRTNRLEILRVEVQ